VSYGTDNAHASADWLTGLDTYAFEPDDPHAGRRPSVADLDGEEDPTYKTVEPRDQDEEDANGPSNGPAKNIDDNAGDPNDR
jgi:hypothetical protein